jgi:hypothetical protein
MEIFKNLLTCERLKRLSPRKTKICDNKLFRPCPLKNLPLTRVFARA